jgi:predicted GIY-YIG superfamily endonuclease
MTARIGTVYLLHFERPYKHARHYTGWTINLKARLARHRAGSGARLVEVVTAAGIGFQLARTWPGGRDRERQIKAQGGASRYCPLCGVTPRTQIGDLPRNANGSLSRSRTTDSQKQSAGVMTSAQWSAHTALLPKPKDNRDGKARARQIGTSQWLTPESLPPAPEPAPAPACIPNPRNGRWI